MENEKIENNLHGTGSTQDNPVYEQSGDQTDHFLICSIWLINPGKKMTCLFLITF